MSRSPVTADDTELAVRLAVGTLGKATDRAADEWDVRAGSLDWTCWETAEHVADDLFAYAARMGPAAPPLTDRVPFANDPRRAQGPRNTIYVHHAAGPAGLVQAVDACGGLLAAMLRTASPDLRAFHFNGVTDPEGFAAMGVAETLLHMHDLARGLGLAWDPPADLCARVLTRLFPDITSPDGFLSDDTTDAAGPWPVLLWATGRGDLPGRDRRTTWRWYGEPMV
jgi:hypothetical protein